MRRQLIGVGQHRQVVVVGIARLSCAVFGDQQQGGVIDVVFAIGASQEGLGLLTQAQGRLGVVLFGGRLHTGAG